jgi:hypothetical protein
LKGALVAVDADDGAASAHCLSKALEMTAAAGGAVDHDVAGHHLQLAHAGAGHDGQVAAATGDRRNDRFAHKPCLAR